MNIESTLTTDLSFNSYRLAIARAYISKCQAKDSRWAKWMNTARKAKADLRREATSLHWYLYLSGKTNVRPSVDMPLEQMSEIHRVALMKHYRDTISSAKAYKIQAG